MVHIRALKSPEDDRQIEALALVLMVCVRDGASVSFMAGLELEDAREFFRKSLIGARADERMVLGAFSSDRLIGTVQLVTNMPPNQPHRAEIAKLLVLPSERGRGVASLLLAAAEDYARHRGKTLLVLDTVTGGAAERIYERLGWTRAGVIPGYALSPFGEPQDTSIFWKKIAG